MSNFNRPPDFKQMVREYVTKMPIAKQLFSNSKPTVLAVCQAQHGQLIGAARGLKEKNSPEVSIPPAGWREQSWQAK